MPLAISTLTNLRSLSIAHAAMHSKYSNLQWHGELPGVLSQLTQLTELELEGWVPPRR